MKLQTEGLSYEAVGKELGILKHENELLKLKLHGGNPELSSSYLQKSTLKENNESVESSTTLISKEKEVSELKTQITLMSKEY